ncbi:MAG: hypothetical protein PVH73_09545 [Candidatus Bathyarchaeota archaeon]|jgi:hypothetical protein
MERTDLTLVIMFAVLNFVFAALIGQVPRLITGIPGIGYLFNVFYSITITIAMLFYQGRRWRFLMQGILFALLTLFLGATQDALLSKISLILNAFVLDLVFSTFYGSFQKKNKLVLWAILGQIYYWVTDSLWMILVFSLFYPWEGVIATWSIIIPFILPLMVIEAIAGGYLGHRIYQRVNKIQN